VASFNDGFNGLTDFLRGEFLFPIDVGVTLESEGGGFEVEDETDLELGDGQIA
jgi:hypothetical protein